MPKSCLCPRAAPRRGRPSLAGIGIAVVALLLLLMPAGCERPPGHRPKAGGGTPVRGVIVAAGDSLTAGYGVDEDQSYPAWLGRRLQAEGVPYRVINAGSSGETSSGLLARLDWLLTLKPAILILETGANDGLRGIDPALTRRNIREIIRRLQERRIVVVLAGMRMVRNLGPEYVKAFEGIYPELARETGVLFMPFFLQGVAADPALNGEDGIHPNAEGYRVVADNLYPYVRQAIAARGQGPALPGR